MTKKPETTTPTEILGEDVRAIAEGIRALRRGPMNERALVLLIQHAIPTPKRGKPISQATVKAVLTGIDALETTYLKKRP